MLGAIRFADRLAQLLGFAAAAVAAVILAAMASFIIVEIVLRNLFGTSTNVMDELVGYGVGAMTFLAMAHTLRNGAMIRVHLVRSALSDGGRRVLEMICVLLTFAGFCVVALYFTRSMIRNFNEGAVSSSVAEVPLWIPDAALLVGLVLLLLQLATYFARLALDPDQGLGDADVTTD